MSVPTATIVAQPFSPVKSVTPPSLNRSFRRLMIHHNSWSLLPSKITFKGTGDIGKRYGVSRHSRLITKELYLKRLPRLREALTIYLGLTPAQREITLELLRYWAYYGLVYPPEWQVTENRLGSKATFWRTIKLLKELGLIAVINRYVFRPHAQISNLYRLDRLCILLLHYLASHGETLIPHWLEPVICQPALTFWQAYGPAGDTLFQDKDCRPVPL